MPNNSAEPSLATMVRTSGWTSNTLRAVMRQRNASLSDWLLALGLVVSALLGVFLTTWRLSANGYANSYYAAAVKAMAGSWHNWFFVAHDSLGYLSIDKPPLGFWLQVLSVHIFGLSPLAILLPQALLGGLAPLALGFLVQRVASPVVAVISAFALALTPIWIVASRDNIVDITLAFTLILGAGALVEAIASSNHSNNAEVTRGAIWREIAWLVVSFTLIGLGFNIKMLEAYLALPAFILTYLFCSRRSKRQRVALLAAALGVMLVVSFAWIEAVDLTPASARPYVDSTSTDSELDLAIGYNGLGRFFGQTPESGATLEFTAPTPSARIGEPGVLRMLQPELGSQGSWLALLAIAGVVIAWPLSRRRKRNLLNEGIPERDQRVGYILFGSWALTGWAFFSIARSIDTYYLVIMIPALCVLAAFGLEPLVQTRGRVGWRAAVSALAVVATCAEQVYLMTHAAPGWASSGLIVFLALMALLALGLALWNIFSGALMALGLSLRQWFTAHKFPLDRVAQRVFGRVTIGALLTVSCLVTPGLWTMSSLTPGNASAHPIAGPQYASVKINRTYMNSRLIQYLFAHRKGATYLAATQYIEDASKLYLNTSQPAIALGGFSGHAPILTPQRLAAMIAKNQIRYILLSSTEVLLSQRKQLYQEMFPGRSGILPGPKFQYDSPVYAWVTANCTPLPPPVWDSESAGSKGLLRTELYDCSALVTMK